MWSQQLQQRLASGSQASCSSRSAPPVRNCSRRRHVIRQHAPHHVTRRGLRVCRAAGPEDEPGAAAAAGGAGGGDLPDEDEVLEGWAEAVLELDPRNDTVFDRMTFTNNNIDLDYDEEGKWAKQVQDWEAFWHEREDEEIMEWEEEEYAGLSPVERSQAAMDKAKALAAQVRDVNLRADVERMLTPDDRVTADYVDTYTSETELAALQPMTRPDPNPDYDAVDLRALAEKRAARGALDAEWRRREALLARPFSFTLRLENDVRIAHADFDWVREEWTEEQIMDLIVGRGQFVHPDKVPVRVLNPLLPIDFHNDVQVHVVPETEEFIESIGHLATEEDILYLQSREDIMLHAKDFVDPTVVFESQEGHVRMPMPANPWAEMRKAQDAEDLANFEDLVERVAAGQRRYDAARDAPQEDQESSGGGDEDGEYDEDEGGPDDGVHGPGFSEFMAGLDPDEQPGVVMYQDELLGQLREADVLDRDEGEEGGEGEDGEDEDGGEEPIPGTDELDQ